MSTFPRFSPSEFRSIDETLGIESLKPLTTVIKVADCTSVLGPLLKHMPLGRNWYESLAFLDSVGVPIDDVLASFRGHETLSATSVN